MPQLLLTDYSLFFGRFHPLVVHLPIGFLLLAAVLEFWPGDRVRPAIRVAWLVGALSAVTAALFGWLLASDGGYGGDTLFWHRWAGVSVAVLAVLGVYVTRNGGKLAAVFSLFTVGALTLAGHQGGNLTHGEDYLFQHAPPILQKIAGHGIDSTEIVDWSTADTDSINLYTSFLRPVLNDKCIRCHNSEKQNGGLRMDESHYLFAGGDGGSIISPGEPLASTWVRRVTLPRKHVKAMPPQGEAMTYSEIRLLDYWIESGADTNAVMVIDEVPDDVKLLLDRDYGLDLRPRLFVETVRGPLLEQQSRKGLESLNWTINDLVPGGPALEAVATSGKEISGAALRELAAAAPQQITSLSLDRQNLSDEDLAVLTSFPNLNRLRLNGTQVGLATVEKLQNLTHLESLNLYDTEVNDEIFQSLAKYPALKRVYLWQTNVSQDAADTFAETHPRVTVDTGFKFKPASTNKSDTK